MKTIGIRELKTHLSRYIGEVKAGETILVTERGRPVAQLIPAPEEKNGSLEERMAALREAGLLKWSGQLPQRFSPRRPTIRLKGDRLASDLLLEDRE